jgi:ABC-type uncharacterized transport system substrate-binding protein
MKTVVVIVALALSILVGPFAAEAQPPKKIPRIGYLGGPGLPARGLDVSRQALRELGYVEGENIAIEPRLTERGGKPARDLVAELAQLGVEVIVAWSTTLALAAQQATRTIPIVFAAVSDPVARGLVASIARPGANVTGIESLSSVELNGKRLELLRQAAPSVTRVAVLRYQNPTLEELPRSSVEALQEAARTLGVAVQLLHVQAPDDLEGAFAAMARERAEALLLVPAGFFRAHYPRIVRFAAERRLPMISGDRSVDQGGLMSYGGRPEESLRRAAAYVDKILKGAKPAELPVEQPMKFELVINRASREG